MKKFLLTALGVLLFTAMAVAQPVTRGLIVKYNFVATDGPVIIDMQRASEPLDLHVPDMTKVQWLTPGLRVLQPVVVKARYGESKLAADAFFTDGITVEAWLKPLNNTQSGPARIITFSADSGNRNFTLGQSATQYVMRFRTSLNPGNGTNPATITPVDVINATPALQHVVYTRAPDGSAKIYVDKVEVATEAVPGDGSNWDTAYDFGLFNETNYPTDERTWLGDIFLATVYNTVLTPAEVAQNFDAGPPAMPVAGTGSGVVTLAWDANTEPDLAGYKIYYGTASRDYTHTVKVAEVPGGWAPGCTEYDPFKTECCEFTITGFTPGETYYFAATAHDVDGNESAYSEELSHTFMPKAQPDEPKNLRRNP
jgi:hypothetical protein